MKNSWDQCNSVLKNQIVASKIKNYTSQNFSSHQNYPLGSTTQQISQSYGYNSPTANWIGTPTMINKI